MIDFPFFRDVNKMRRGLIGIGGGGGGVSGGGTRSDRPNRSAAKELSGFCCCDLSRKPGRV